MNIYGAYRNILHYLNLGPAVVEPQAEKEVQQDGDGPGAGGGYEDSVEISPSDAGDVNDNDGPGAGGGYDKRETEKPSEAEKPDVSDGPGAGGGYDDADDVKDDDSDGPGAGGGYDDADDVKAGRYNLNDGPGAGGGYFYDEHPVTGQSNTRALVPWTPEARGFLGEQWFIAPKAANSNEAPPKKPQEGEKK